MQRFRFGLTQCGVTALKMRFASHIREEIFEDHFLDKQEAIEQNEWHKLRLCVGKATEEIIKRNISLIENVDEDDISYLQTKKAVESLASTQSRVYAKIKVRRTLIEAVGRTITLVVDSITYPEGDPHCVCSLQYDLTNAEDSNEISLPKDVLYLLAGNKIDRPVRSSIVEYLWRYDRAAHTQLEKNGFVSRAPYAPNILQS